MPITEVGAVIAPRGCSQVEWVATLELARDLVREAVPDYDEWFTFEPIGDGSWQTVAWKGDHGFRALVWERDLGPTCSHRCMKGKHCGGCGCPGCGYKEG